VALIGRRQNGEAPTLSRALDLGQGLTGARAAVGASDVDSSGCWRRDHSAYPAKLARRRQKDELAAGAKRTVDRVHAPLLAEQRPDLHRRLRPV